MLVFKKRVILVGIILFFMLALLIKPERYIASVYNGLILFSASVLPALFPFFFFTKLLTALGLSDALSKVCKKPINKLYRTNEAGGYIFVMSMLSGYPVGAKLISEFYENKFIQQSDCKTISTFSSTSGPIFIVGTVGATMLLSKAAGLILLVCHIISSLINGLLYKPKKQAQPQNFNIAPVAKPMGMDKILGNSIYSAIISVFIVGGYIAVFNLVIDVLYDVKVLYLFENLITAFLNLINQPAQLAKGITFSFFEVTRGTLELSKTAVSLNKLLPIISAFLAFGGAGIIMQSYTFLSKCKIKFGFHVLAKITQAVISFVVAYLLCLVIPF